MQLSYYVYYETYKNIFKVLRYKNIFLQQCLSYNSPLPHGVCNWYKA